MAEFPKRSQHPWDDQLKAYIDRGDAAKPEVDLSGVEAGIDSLDERVLATEAGLVEITGRALPEGGTEGQIVSRTAEGAAWTDAPKGGAGSPFDSINTPLTETFTKTGDYTTAPTITPNLSRRVLNWNFSGLYTDEESKDYYGPPSDLGKFQMTLPGADVPQVIDGEVQWLAEHTVHVRGMHMIEWVGAQVVGKVSAWEAWVNVIRRVDGGWTVIIPSEGGGGMPILVSAFNFKDSGIEPKVGFGAFFIQQVKPMWIAEFDSGTIIWVDGTGRMAYESPR